MLHPASAARFTASKLQNMVVAMPRTAVSEPNVTMNGGSFRSAMSAPLITPNPKPTASAAGTSGLRLLEIGAGTGATTAHVLPLLPPDTAEYLFTDLSPRFTSEAPARFAAWPFLRGARLDIETDPQAQGMELGSFDIVLAANVLHATRDLGQTLTHARKLLRHGGQLVLLEGTAPRRWIDLTFGLLEGWWRFEDRRVLRGEAHRN